MMLKSTLKESGKMLLLFWIIIFMKNQCFLKAAVSLKSLSFLRVYKLIKSNIQLQKTPFCTFYYCSERGTLWFEVFMLTTSSSYNFRLAVPKMFAIKLAS